jgi:hypothetical protein
MISRNFGRWLSLMGLLLILFSAVGPYFLHIPFANSFTGNGYYTEPARILERFAGNTYLCGFGIRTR